MWEPRLESLPVTGSWLKVVSGQGNILYGKKDLNFTKRTNAAVF